MDPQSPMCDTCELLILCLVVPNFFNGLKPRFFQSKCFISLWYMYVCLLWWCAFVWQMFQCYIRFSLHNLQFKCPSELNGLFQLLLLLQASVRPSSDIFTGDPLFIISKGALRVSSSAGQFHSCVQRGQVVGTHMNICYIYFNNRLSAKLIQFCR